MTVGTNEPPEEATSHISHRRFNLFYVPASRVRPVSVIYLEVARQAARNFDGHPSGESTKLYNQAVANLTVLLRAEKSDAF